MLDILQEKLASVLQDIENITLLIVGLQQEIPAKMQELEELSAMRAELEDAIAELEE